VGVAEQVLLLAYIGGAKNPYFDTRIEFDYLQSYLALHARNLFSFRPYQKRQE
jgi:hypothetical protein